ncbi:hypothetical protein ACROYT_G018014 [Oculina patagonica]
MGSNSAYRDAYVTRPQTQRLVCLCEQFTFLVQVSISFFLQSSGLEKQVQHEASVASLQSYCALVNSQHEGKCRITAIVLHLRTPEERVRFLKNVKSHYNFRLVTPESNLMTMSDCIQEASEEWAEFCDSTKKTSLKVTVTDLEKGNENGITLC